MEAKYKKAKIIAKFLGYTIVQESFKNVLFLKNGKLVYIDQSPVNVPMQTENFLLNHTNGNFVEETSEIFADVQKITDAKTIWFFNIKHRYFDAISNISALSPSECDSLTLFIDNTSVQVSTDKLCKYPIFTCFANNISIIIETLPNAPQPVLKADVLRLVAYPMDHLSLFCTENHLFYKRNEIIAYSKNPKVDEYVMSDEKEINVYSWGKMVISSKCVDKNGRRICILPPMYSSQYFQLNATNLNLFDILYRDQEYLGDSMFFTNEQIIIREKENKENKEKENKEKENKEKENKENKENIGKPSEVEPLKFEYILRNFGSNSKKIIVASPTKAYCFDNGKMTVVNL